MSLPLFSDIGKQVKELFEKNFFFDIVKFEMSNSLTSYMSYKGNQTYSIKDGKMTAEIEGKYEADGIVVIPKVTTESSVISGDIKVQRPEFKGVNLIVSGNYNPKDGKKSVALGLNYSGPEYNIEVASIGEGADPKLKLNGTVLRLNGVVNLFGWIFGASVIMDPNGKMQKSNLVGGFQDGRTSFFVNCDPQQKQVTGSVYNYINSNIQTGLVYGLGGSTGQADKGEKGQPSLAFCANYVLNAGATLKARINADYLLGLAYILQLKDGISVTMCTEIDAQKLKQGGHKIGFGIQLS